MLSNIGPATRRATCATAPVDRDPTAGPWLALVGRRPGRSVGSPAAAAAAGLSSVGLAVRLGAGCRAAVRSCRRFWPVLPAAPCPSAVAVAPVGRWPRLRLSPACLVGAGGVLRGGPWVVSSPLAVRPPGFVSLWRGSACGGCLAVRGGWRCSLGASSAGSPRPLWGLAGRSGGRGAAGRGPAGAAGGRGRAGPPGGGRWRVVLACPAPRPSWPRLGSGVRRAAGLVACSRRSSSPRPLAPCALGPRRRPLPLEDQGSGGCAPHDSLSPLAVLSVRRSSARLPWWAVARRGASGGVALAGGGPARLAVVAARGRPGRPSRWAVPAPLSAAARGGGGPAAPRPRSRGVASLPRLVARRGVSRRRVSWRARRRVLGRPAPSAGPGLAGAAGARGALACLGGRAGSARGLPRPGGPAPVPGLGAAGGPLSRAPCGVRRGGAVVPRCGACAGVRSARRRVWRRRGPPRRVASWSRSRRPGPCGPCRLVSWPVRRCRPPAPSACARGAGARAAVAVPPARRRPSRGRPVFVALGSALRRPPWRRSPLSPRGRSCASLVVRRARCPVPWPLGGVARVSRSRPRAAPWPPVGARVLGLPPWFARRVPCLSPRLSRPLVSRHQPRSRHSARCGRSRPAWSPSVPRVEPVSSGNRSNTLCSTSSIKLPNVFRARGLADPAGEQRVAGEQVGYAGRVPVDQRDRAGRVTDQRHDLELDPADLDPVAVGELGVGRAGDRLGVVAPGRGPGAGGGHHLGEGLPVVPVPVRRDDLLQRGRRRAARAAWLRRPRRRPGRARRSRGTPAGTRCCPSARPRPW